MRSAGVASAAEERRIPQETAYQPNTEMHCLKRANPQLRDQFSVVEIVTIWSVSPLFQKSHDLRDCHR